MVFNAIGQHIEMLVDEFQFEGEHQVNWSANDFSSGLYFYRLQAGDNVETKKLIFN